MNTKHTDSVEAEFKQKFCRPRITPLKDEIPMLHSVTQAQDIIDWITTLQATHQQQVEEAVEAEKKRILDELWRLVEWHRQEKNQMFGIVSANTTINALHQARGIVRGDNHASASNTPNHQD